MSFNQVSLNGVPIGLVLIIIAVHPYVIHKAPVQALSVLCGAVLGAAALHGCV